MDVMKIKDENFRVYVASDAHYWPGKPSTAHRGLVGMMGQYPADVVVLNGDMFDFPGISKYPPNDWPAYPSVKKEIECVQARLKEIAAAAAGWNKNGCHLVWTVGNHDARFNKALAAKAGAFKGLPGTKLADYFPDWTMCNRVIIGDTVIKHELKGGSNPLKSNLQAAGQNIVTGHHHCQNVLAYTDYRGTRYAVDSGMLARVDGPQFDYGEGNPANWRSGFAVLQFWKGKLLPPQLCTVLDEKKGAMWFNGYNYKF